MIKYIRKTGLFLVICFAIITFVMLQYGANIDYFYNKFTTPQAKSMILGDSRSMQGIQPSIMNEYLKDTNFELPLFNYSFTIAQAPIGPLYTKSIFKKLDTSVKDGVFIISVTPWMLSSDKHNDNEKGEFKEANEPPHNMNFVSVNPNYEYLLRNLNYFHFKAMFRKNSTMHKDGWLEGENLPNSEAEFKAWKKIQKDMFSRMATENVVSSYRLKSLDTLVKRLKSHGNVYLVRMPLDTDMLDIENTFYQNFNEDIKEIAKSNVIPYFNFTNNQEVDQKFNTYDGHHLDKIGSTSFTKELSELINKNK